MKYQHFSNQHILENKKLIEIILESNDENLIGSQVDFILNKNDELTIFKIGGYVNSNDSEKKRFY